MTMDGNDAAPAEDQQEEKGSQEGSSGSSENTSQESGTSGSEEPKPDGDGGGTSVEDEELQGPEDADEGEPSPTLLGKAELLCEKISTVNMFDYQADALLKRVNDALEFVENCEKSNTKTSENTESDS